MGIWQIYMIAFASVELLYVAHLHGKPRKDTKYNFWNPFVGWFIFIFFLIKGGFFS